MIDLEASSLLSSLSAAAVQQLRQAACVESFPAGQVIYREGDEGTGLYLIRSGRVQISALINETQRRVLARIEPGDCFGEMEVLDGEPRSTTALAEVDTAVYCIPRFITQLVAEMRAEAAPRSIQIRLEDPPPELRVSVDADRLTHVFYNLLQNAQDAMPGGGVVRLRFRVADGEVTTEIEDNGPGMAPEVAQCLFEPFVTQGKPHAAGLGLSICKRIVEDHHGRIAARSGAGRGAVFTVTLPIAS